VFRFIWLSGVIKKDLELCNEIPEEATVKRLIEENKLNRIMDLEKWMMELVMPCAYLIVYCFMEV
jgi:hypothetical protein